ncbi:MAG: histidine phosphatase family protein [Lachnospiraceae bacterium]|nr:histidine phosphatase family protein [Lachnospiraceae bacterium]
MSKITLYFYRHGETESNAQGLCAGRTDVPVSEEGLARLKDIRHNYDFPDVQLVFSSPAKRCITTAGVYYPDREPIVYDHLWEVDYGTVDNEPIAVLDEAVGKERYIAKDPAAIYPEGESYLEASFRIRAGMTRVISECTNKGATKAAIFIHGDIMDTLFRVCLETDQSRAEFLLCPNGMGYSCHVDSEKWFVDQKIYFEDFIPEGAPRPRVEDSPYFSGM